MSKICMYAHGGSGNHGCEAIVRSTLKILEEIESEKVLFSMRPEEDKLYDIDKLCSVLGETGVYSKMSFEFLKAYVELKVKHNYVSMDKLSYRNPLKGIKKGDIALSIGGDNYCYSDNKRYIMLHDLLLECGAKTVLWGCSVEPQLLEYEYIANDLKRYSLITARESISYEALKKINPNTILISDPAFVLEKEEIICLENREYIGINISPMIIEKENNSGITMKNYEKLVEFILEKTELNIMLVPHVVWSSNDDRIPLRKLYDKYKESKRILLLEDMSCEKLKGYISKCRYFIGARTHSTIAAYSSCVPTLVVGYSVKAIGIAKDIFGTDEKYVIPVQKLQEENELLEHVQWLMKNEDRIKQMLSEKMNNYKEKAFEAGIKLKEILR